MQFIPKTWVTTHGRNAITATLLCGLAVSVGAQSFQPRVPATHIRRHAIVKRPTKAQTSLKANAATQPAWLSNLIAWPGYANSNAVTPGAPWSEFGPAPLINGNSPDINGNDSVSGRIVGIAPHPTDPNIIYIAAAGGGVWKTTNGGTNWVPMTDSQPDLAMGAIAISPSNPNIIYAGTGEANNSADSRYGVGILKSTDAGLTWTVLAGNANQNEFYRRAIAKIVVAPTDPNTLYIAVSDFAANGLRGNTGIWKSTDGGTTWTNTTTSINTVSPFSDVVMDPSNPQVLYAAVGNVYGSIRNGVYKTTNGGTSWVPAGNFPIGGKDGRIAIAISPSSPQTLYASIENVETGGLLNVMKTTDGGANWTALANVPNFLGGQGWYDTTIIVNPTNPNIVYAGGVVNYNTGGDSIVGSIDGGTTWIDYTNDVNGNAPHTDHHGLAFDANGLLLDGNDGGIWKLQSAVPSNLQWLDLNGNLGTIQFTGIALHPTDRTIAYGGSQDNGTEKYTGSTTWTQVQGGDGGFVRVDQVNPNTVYHTFYFSGPGFLERSDDGGVTWNGITTGIVFDNPPPAEEEEDAANFYPPYLIDPTNHLRLVLGTDHVYESLDQGENWTLIATPDVNGFESDDVPVDSLGVYGSTVYASAGGKIFVTTNDGALWTERDVPNFSDEFNDFFVTESNPQDVYVTRGKFSGSSTGHVFHSTNGGATWTDITSNLGDLPVNAIKVDPTTQAIYVGTDIGVYASFNNGTSWSRFGTGIPNAQVVGLELNPTLQILAAGTHGRGMWEIPLGATVSALSLDTSTTVGGSTVNGTVYLSAPAGASGMDITLLSSDPTTASVPASIHIAAGAMSGTFKITTSSVTSTHNVTITATDPNNIQQQAFLAVTAPAAPIISISSLDPAIAFSANAPYTLTVNGSNFTANSAVNWNGFPLTTKFISATQLTATVPGSLRAQANNASITVALSGGANRSNPVIEPVWARFTAFDLSTASAVGGNSVIATVTLNSPAISPGDTIHLTSSNPTVASIASTVYVGPSASSGTITITTSPVSVATTVTITATGDGGNFTKTLTLTPQQTISSLSPSIAYTDSSSYTLTVNGTNFAANSVIRWNGTALTTTFVSSTQLTAVVPGSLRTQASNATIIVSGPAGVNPSNSLTETVLARFTALSLSATSVVGGGSITGTIGMNAAVTAPGAKIYITSSKPSSASVPASVAIATSATSGTFTITTSPVAVDTVITITAVGNAGNISKTFTIKHQ